VDVWHYMDGRQAASIPEMTPAEISLPGRLGYPTSYVEKLQKTIKRLK